MSLPNSTNFVPAQKPDTGVYTIMLFVAFFCLVTGSVLLHLEVKEFLPQMWKDAPRVSSGGS